MVNSTTCGWCCNVVDYSVVLSGGSGSGAGGIDGESAVNVSSLILSLVLVSTSIFLLFKLQRGYRHALFQTQGINTAQAAAKV